ncbi:hypothetical protein SUB0292 [Streptococcus uberis 0140J]|uniref:Uncharacterized protein n=1 Tax=Streptococcus uberis (strain ATCC BAA-854 / 0140J) TaxID=218495 RepID=B9DTG7_STRU0|nr:hypothetical protein SUB0292 [Streptococcus uberis 0140J]
MFEKMMKLSVFNSKSDFCHEINNYSKNTPNCIFICIF